MDEQQQLKFNSIQYQFKEIGLIFKEVSVRNKYPHYPADRLNINVGLACLHCLVALGEEAKTLLRDIHYEGNQQKPSTGEKTNAKEDPGESV